MVHLARAQFPRTLDQLARPVEFPRSLGLVVEALEISWLRQVSLRAAAAIHQAAAAVAAFATRLFGWESAHRVTDELPFEARAASRIDHANHAMHGTISEPYRSRSAADSSRHKKIS